MKTPDMLNMSRMSKYGSNPIEHLLTNEQKNILGKKGGNLKNF